MAVTMEALVCLAKWGPNANPLQGRHHHQKPSGGHKDKDSIKQEGGVMYRHNFDKLVCDE